MVGDNIKKLRESLGMTQAKFADRIGIRQNSVALIESNKRNISQQNKLAISREFGVRIEWLETGEGEMYKTPDESILAQLEKTYSLSPKSRELVENFLKLPPEARDLVADAIAALAEKYPRKTEPEPQDQKPDEELTREEMHAKLDAELDAKEAAAKRGTSTSSAFTISSGSAKKVKHGT